MSSVSTERPQLHLVFRALAVLNLAALLGALWLGHDATSHYRRAIVEARASSAHIGALVTLGELTREAAAPGNDVFTSNDAPGERARLNDILSRIQVHIAQIEAFGAENLGPADRSAQAASVAALRTALQRLSANADLVFQDWQAGRPIRAARHMAEMDQASREMLAAVAELTRRQQRLQLSRLHTEFQNGSMLAKSEFWAGVGLLVVVFAMVAYGIAFSREMQRNADQLEFYAHSLEDGHKLLETRVRERTAELEFARSAAAAANEAKSKFIANMSHELRTPLSSIKSYSELLREIAEDEGRLDEIDDIDKIIEASRHLLTLVNDILDLSKIEAGKATLAPTDYDPAQVVASVAKIVGPLAKQNGNTLNVSIARGLRCAHNDEQKIRQCMLNLASNAVKFTRDGEVTLSASSRERQGETWLVFETRDNGIGIRPEKLAKLFQPFVQAETSTTREFGGTGLGLSITKQLVELMGGQIEAESTPDKGSIFRFEVPLDLRLREWNETGIGAAA